MAGKKTKTHPQRTPVKYDSKAYNEKAYTTIRKILQVYGFDPNLLDAFSKQQRRFLMFVTGEPFRFKAEEGHRVPRRLINFVAESTQRFLRTHYFGDESIGLTYFELATYGMAFSTTVQSEYECRTFPPEQLKIIDDLAACFDENRVRKDLDEVGSHIRHLMLMISKVNFRVYGFKWSIGYHHDEKKDCIRSEVRIFSENSKSIYFTYKNKDRVAFSVRAGRVSSHPTYDARIDRWFVTSEDDKKPVYLDIYIQSHALQRIKERMDIFPAHVRNFYAMEPLLYMHRVSKLPSGPSLFECYTKSGDTVVRFGYYPFVIRNKKLIVLSFLPIVSTDAMEGSILHRILGLQMEDTIFLGMDKLSFFCTVDFEQIPVLKQAMIDAHIWDLIVYISKHPDVNFSIDQKKTLMVKKFFEKKIELND
jgi:hypothetical protein